MFCCEHQKFSLVSRVISSKGEDPLKRVCQKRGKIVSGSQACDAYGISREICTGLILSTCEHALVFWFCIGPVVQWVCNAIDQINHYPVDKC